MRLAKASNDERRTVFATVSLLLQYPDEQLHALVPVLESAVADLPSDSRVPLLRFLDHVTDTRLLDLQQEYVATFDLKRRNCLYLTYYLNGDTRRRGMALWRFQHAYRQRGFSVAGGELPDFLPAVLELAASGHEDMALALMLEHQPGIHVLRESLDAMTSSYAHVVRALELILPEPSAAVRAAALTLAAEGPPAEAVGLEPFFSVESLRVRS